MTTPAPAAEPVIILIGPKYTDEQLEYFIFEQDAAIEFPPPVGLKHPKKVAQARRWLERADWMWDHYFAYLRREGLA